MEFHRQLLKGIAALTIAMAFCGAAFAQALNPTDEAKLYELAKKEGKLVWYGSSAQEVMKINADAFSAKYPGITVEILRVVGVAQYQR